MLNQAKRIESFAALGSFISDEISKSESEWIDDLCRRAKLKNGWFEKREVLFALNYWADTLSSSQLKDWLSQNNITEASDGECLKVGLVLAGNIPMVGFHDMLATLLIGHIAQVKLSSNDDVLIPMLFDKLSALTPGIEDHFEFVDRLTDYQAVLATGSNNSARHFEQYFGHVPNVIRKNRTGVAILRGDESSSELEGLMHDCFRYFGLGCRNVTKLYLPEKYDLNEIFAASLPFAYLMDNKKYANNYTYHKALMMMERKYVLENELILMIEEPSLFSPVSVLNYEFYKNEAALGKRIEENLDQTQCVVGKNQVPFGMGQKPTLNDFADGINTLNFLQNLEAVQLPN